MSLSTDGLCDPNSFLSSKLSTIADVDDTPRAKRLLKRQIVAEAKRQTESNTVLERSHAKSNGLLIKKTGKLGLPREVACRIMENLCDEYEPEGIRVFPVVASELVNVALSCPDFLVVLPHCYDYLASKMNLRKLLPDGHDWNRLISEPAAFSVEELKATLRVLEKSADGYKGGMFLKLVIRF